MKRIHYIVSTILFFVITPCFATLGETSTSIEADRAAFHAVKQEISNEKLYKIESYQIATVTNVREYVDKEGTVFAVCWSGKLKPNLPQLLGQHYPTLLNAINKKVRGGRAPVYIKRRDIVIESSGHPGYFYGRAYLPAALPGGVKESELVACE